jgi:hypothetical protein
MGSPGSCAAAPALVDVDPPIQRGREREHHRAFHLLGHDAGFTTVPQSMAQTTRCTRGTPASSETSTTWATTEPNDSCSATRGTPGRSTGRPSRHAALPARAPPDGAAHLSAACGAAPPGPAELRRDLVDERLGKEGVVRMADRAPEADRHARRVATCSIFWLANP